MRLPIVFAMVMSGQTAAAPTLRYSSYSRGSPPWITRGGGFAVPWELCSTICQPNKASEDTAGYLSGLRARTWLQAGKGPVV